MCSEVSALSPELHLSDLQDETINLSYCERRHMSGSFSSLLVPTYLIIPVDILRPKINWRALIRGNLEEKRHLLNYARYLLNCM